MGVKITIKLGKATVRQSVMVYKMGKTKKEGSIHWPIKPLDVIPFCSIWPCRDGAAALPSLRLASLWCVIHALWREGGRILCRRRRAVWIGTSGRARKIEKRWVCFSQFMERARELCFDLSGKYGNPGSKQMGCQIF